MECANTEVRWEIEQLTHVMVRYHWNIVGLRDALKKKLVRCQQMTDTRFISVKRRTDMSMGLDFLCIRT